MRRPANWLDEIILRRIHIHTRDDNTIEGTLTHTTPDGLVLAAAVLHVQDQNAPNGIRSTPMAGETFVPRERIAFVQNVGSEGS